MAQANVYTTVSNQTWYTDKARIITGTSPITFQVDVLYPSATGNMYGAPSAVSANSMLDIYVGVGNKLTITGTATVQEVGTASSGQVSVRDTGGTLPF